MSPDARKTALYELHKEAGGRIVEFAGWLMPVWFAGIGREHETVRTKAGMFDVSHMGQILVTGEDASQVVDYLVTNAVGGLEAGRALYTPTLNRQGGIVDDLIVYKKSDTELLLCVNASTIDKDLCHFVENNRGSASVENVSDEYSQLAVQGPRSFEVLHRVWPALAASLKPFDFVELEHEGHEAMIAATGYTGERGYELYVPWNSGPHFWRLFMDAGREAGIAPIGLGARDTLRLEARFCLYGNDIDETTNPLEAGLKWTVDFDSDFLGKAALERVLEEKVRRRLVGFRMLDRGVPRQHYPIYREGAKIGEVTSGTRSPTLGESIGLGYIDVPFHKRGREIDIEIRGKMAGAKIVRTPFYRAEE